MSAVATIAGDRVAAIRPYRPGRPPGPARGAGEAGKLSSNEAPLGPAPAVRAAIAAAAAAAHRYATSDELRATLGEHLGRSPEGLVLTSGSDELCYLLATLFIAPGRRVVLSDPCYRIDELVTRVHDGAPAYVALREDGGHDLDGMAAAAQDAAVLWLPSPHNPTGAAVEPGGLARLLRDVPATCLVVLDEAYRDFVDPERRPTVGALLDAHPNLVVQRTFSKAYAIAGLRVGYALAAPELIAAVDAIRPPFNVGSAGLAAATAALGAPEWRDFGVEMVRRGRTRLQDHLGALGFAFVPSQANFVCARIPEPDALHARLATRGLAVRDGGDLGMEGWTRISIGAPPAMALLRAALREHRESLPATEDA